MDGLDSLLFINFGDLSIYQKSISFVEFVTVIRINASLFSLQLHKPNHPDRILRQVLKLANHKSRSKQWNCAQLYSEEVSNTLWTILISKGYKKYGIMMFV